jgi:LDH2 family malate/lactate/ureidoglycolate dehydrogenase
MLPRLKFIRRLQGRKRSENAYGIQNGKNSYHLGHFFIAIDTEAFMGSDIFKKTAGDILRALRASRRMQGCDRIYTAGEKEYLTYMDRKDKGLPVNEGVQKELIAVRDELKLNQYRFSFE